LITGVGVVLPACPEYVRRPGLPLGHAGSASSDGVIDTVVRLDVDDVNDIADSLNISIAISP
jgi:hypothetical protein